ncbi:MAG: histidinol dehydrogenase [Anaerolineales bacterium]|jgi:histidinol dehydrogenase
MLKIMQIDEAKATILRRDPASQEDYPQTLLNGVAEIFGEGVGPADAVTRILKSVRDEGDAAVQRWTETLDKVRLEDTRIPEDKLAEAYNGLPESLAEAMRLSAVRVRDFHERQPKASWTTEEMGGMLGQRVAPIERAGVYVPGGSAPLPSSLLMSVIPAQVAGVREIVVCTPPQPHDTILAAAHICGLRQVFTIGGAQAIAAMAYGTESVPRVDKIVGAGNLFVTLAKQQVFGIVGIEGLAGPTETMVIADATANPEWVAADLLAQAEHDPLASAILLTSDRNLAQAVQAAVARQVEDLSRVEIIAASLAHRGGIVLTPDLETATALANDYAAEHLCLCVAEAGDLASKIRNAGGIFMGERSFEVLGDYVAGPSHVMPTGGTARFASPLNVWDFVKITSLIALDAETSAALSATAAQIAQVETLTAHAAAAQRRIEGEQ